MYHGSGPPLAPGLAVGAYALAVACFFSIGLWLGGGLGPAAVAQLVALAGVPWLVVRLHGGTKADLGIVAPPLLGMIGAIIVGCGLWLVALRLATPVARATDAEPALRALSTELLTGPTAAILLVYGVVPAVCEELLHRGLLLGALTPRLGKAIAIAITTGLFAALHLEPARMVSAGLVGVAAGSLAAWSRSLGPAITVHAVNNLVALGLGLGLWPGLVGVIARHPDPAVAIAAGLVLAGLALGWIGRQRM